MNLHRNEENEKDTKKILKHGNISHTKRNWSKRLTLKSYINQKNQYTTQSSLQHIYITNINFHKPRISPECPDHSFTLFPITVRILNHSECQIRKNLFVIHQKSVKKQFRFVKTKFYTRKYRIVSTSNSLSKHVYEEVKLAVFKKKKKKKK